ncbi:putative C2H2 transcription factor (Swi5) [Aspergillus lucknowensis]|uniref:C2H2 type master regulator of conidiophore development brlA n=1 Tax=Aspergillus lucknowensis TaxID=176173 RepID=A0ABR4LR09_9EURO
MLSNSQSTLHGRHQRHRRQISTPSALDAAKPQSLPSQAMHRYHAHRRGQSLDQRAVQAQRPQPKRDASATNQQLSFSPTSTLASTMPEIQLRQHDIQALNRGTYQDTQNMPLIHPNFVKNEDQTRDSRPVNYHLNLIQQQQQQLHDAKLGYHGTLEGQILDNSSWDICKPDLASSLQHVANTPPNDMRRHSIHSNESTSYEPQTPTKSNTQYFPISPATTPFNRAVDLAQYCPEMQVSPAKGQNIANAISSQPEYMQRARSLQGVAGTTFSQPKIEMPSPPNTTLFAIDDFDTFDCSQGSSLDILKPGDISQSQYSLSSASSSFPSPEIAAIRSSEECSEKKAKVPICPVTPSRLSPRKHSSTPSAASSVKPKLSPRVATIDNLNLDARVHASIKETGVTIDEIAAYIHGPDPEDGKWVCLHPGCQRRFGRKENIKSHVQTHLGDRQYKCDHCDKCFVRGHDLKRHAKIHTGDKPYECLCGNVFARHDALTRHRQRGMCIGGYKGIVRKATKRGRPKKQRPEMEERREKASKTRLRIAEKLSFDSSGSDSSRQTPPSEILESMSLHGSSSADEMGTFDNPNYLPPEVFTFTPPESPSYGMASKPGSPRSLTPSSEDEMLPLSPSKRPMEKIMEDSGLPVISDAGTCSFSTVSNSSTHAFSSPHTAATLSEASQPSDLDIFINHEPSSSFTKQDFPGLDDSDMATFPDYVNTSSFDTSLDILQGKNFSTGPTMGDDFFSFQFQVDDQPSDVMSREFFLD